MRRVGLLPFLFAHCIKKGARLCSSACSMTWAFSKDRCAKPRNTAGDSQPHCLQQLSLRIPSEMIMPGVVPPPSHSVVVVLKPLADAPTCTWGGAHPLSLGVAAVMACMPHMHMLIINITDHKLPDEYLMTKDS